MAWVGWFTSSSDITVNSIDKLNSTSLICITITCILLGILYNKNRMTRQQKQLKTEFLENNSPDTVSYENDVLETSGDRDKAPAEEIQQNEFSIMEMHENPGISDSNELSNDVISVSSIKSATSKSELINDKEKSLLISSDLTDCDKSDLNLEEISPAAEQTAFPSSMISSSEKKVIESMDDQENEDLKENNGYNIEKESSSLSGLNIVSNFGNGTIDDLETSSDTTIQDIDENNHESVNHFPIIDQKQNGHGEDELTRFQQLESDLHEKINIGSKEDQGNINHTNLVSTPPVQDVGYMHDDTTTVEPDEFIINNISSSSLDTTVATENLIETTTEKTIGNLHSECLTSISTITTTLAPSLSIENNENLSLDTPNNQETFVKLKKRSIFAKPTNLASLRHVTEKHIVAQKLSTPTQLPKFTNDQPSFSENHNQGSDKTITIPLDMTSNRPEIVEASSINQTSYTSDKVTNNSSPSPKPILISQLKIRKALDKKPSWRAPDIPIPTSSPSQIKSNINNNNNGRGEIDDPDESPLLTVSERLALLKVGERKNLVFVKPISNFNINKNGVSQRIMEKDQSTKSLTESVIVTSTETSEIKIEHNEKMGNIESEDMNNTDQCFSKDEDNNQISDDIHHSLQDNHERENSSSEYKENQNENFLSDSIKSNSNPVIIQNSTLNKVEPEHLENDISVENPVVYEGKEKELVRALSIDLNIEETNDEWSSEVSRILGLVDNKESTMIEKDNFSSEHGNVESKEKKSLSPSHSQEMKTEDLNDSVTTEILRQDSGFISFDHMNKPNIFLPPPPKSSAPPPPSSPSPITKTPIQRRPPIRRDPIRKKISRQMALPSDNNISLQSGSEQISNVIDSSLVLDIGKNLTHLNLRGRGLINLPTSLVVNLFQSLEILDLSRNRFECLPSWIRNCIKLKELYLNDNIITMVAHHDFESSSPSMEVIDLSCNRISLIAPDAFLSQKRLITLKLHSNRLRNLPSSIGLCKNLKRLTIHQNPLVPSLLTFFDSFFSKSLSSNYNFDRPHSFHGDEGETCISAVSHLQHNSNSRLTLERHVWRSTSLDSIHDSTSISESFLYIMDYLHDLAVIELDVEPEDCMKKVVSVSSTVTSSSSNMNKDSSIDNVIPTPPPMPVSDEEFQKYERIRKHITDEILATERTYVSHLSSLIVVYLDPIIRESLLTIDEVSSVFGNWKSIEQFHREFVLPELEAGVTSGKGVGEVFIRLGQLFKMYEEYYNNLPRAMMFVASLDPTSSSISASLGSTNTVTTPVSMTQRALAKSTIRKSKLFLSKALTHPQHSQISLSAYLILPVQRLPRYKLLLDSLIKATPKGTPQCESILKAAEVIRNRVEGCNEAKREAERREGIKWALKRAGYGIGKVNSNVMTSKISRKYLEETSGRLIKCLRLFDVSKGLEKIDGKVSVVGGMEVIRIQSSILIWWFSDLIVIGGEGGKVYFNMEVVGAEVVSSVWGEPRYETKRPLKRETDDKIIRVVGKGQILYLAIEEKYVNRLIGKVGSILMK